jgi:hypothetical protein
VEGVFKYDIFDTELCKCHNVLPFSTTIKKKKAEEKRKNVNKYGF